MQIFIRHRDHGSLALLTFALALGIVGAHQAAPDLRDQLVGAARLPLVLIGQQTTQLPAGDYLSSVGGASFNGIPPSAAGDIRVTTINGIAPPVGVGSVAATHTSGVFGAVNLSTFGTFDWYDCGSSSYASGALASATVSQSSHAKLAPTGLPSLYTSFQGLGQVSFATAAPGLGDTFSSTAADDQTLIADNSTSACFYFTTGGEVGWGIRMQVQATATQRVLRIYSSAQSCLITTTATLTKSGTSATDTFNVPGAIADDLVTITFTGGTSGDQLYVTQVCSVGHGGTVELGIAGISLGPV